MLPSIISLICPQTPGAILQQVICHLSVWTIKLQGVDYSCNICVRMCLMLHFACSDAILLTDLEARNQISQCLEGILFLKLESVIFLFAST